MATFTVTTTSDSVNAGDGQLSLREAVGRANGRDGADRIEFSQAVGGGRLVLTRGQLVVDDDVQIDGSRENENQTTIDGNQASRVLRVDGVGSHARLEDLLVTGGYTPDPISSNTAPGGGILLDDGTSLDLLRSTVIENSSSAYYGSRGGGVAGYTQTSINVVNSAILNNNGSQGGGIYADRGSRVRIEDSLLSGNTAFESRSGDGGALFLVEASTEIVKSTISDNVADYNAGGIVASGGTLSISNSTIADNVAQNDSGRGAPADAGAISASDVVLQSSTITGNAVGKSFDSYYAVTGGIDADRLRVADSIVAGNFEGEPGEPGRSADDIAAGTLISNAHNVFGTEVPGAVDGDSEGEPLDEIFASIDPSTGGGRLALNGGETPTAALAVESFNPALSGADTRTAPDVDQRGFVRPAPDGTNPDVGAYELRQNTTPTEPTPFNDAIVGSAAAETIRAASGNDLLRGFAGNDQLFGEGGSDTLFGAGGDDRVFGGPGAELVSGGPNVDQLTGGPGRDAFDIDQGHTGVGSGSRDRLLDFDRDDDLIDLAGVDARSGTGGDQAFAFIGTSAFSGPGQLRYGSSGSDTLIQGSTDGDRSAELELQVTGRLALGADDFVL